MIAKKVCLLLCPSDWLPPFKSEVLIQSVEPCPEVRGVMFALVTPSR